MYRYTRTYLNGDLGRVLDSEPAVLPTNVSHLQCNVSLVEPARMNGYAWSMQQWAMQVINNNNIDEPTVNIVSHLLKSKTRGFLTSLSSDEVFCSGSKLKLLAILLDRPLRLSKATLDTCISSATWHYSTWYVTTFTWQTGGVMLFAQKVGGADSCSNLVQVWSSFLIFLQQTVSQLTCSVTLFK